MFYFIANVFTEYWKDILKIFIPRYLKLKGFYN